MAKNTDDFRTRQIDGILFKTESCYPGMEFDPVSIPVWHDALAEYRISEISEAFSQHVKEAEFLPRISQIINRIKNKIDPQISIEVRALQQWGIVLTAVNKYGKAKPPEFSDPITAHLVRNQISWSYLCNMKQDDEKWEEKRWCEAYKLASEAHPNLIKIEAPQKVQELVKKLTHSVVEPGSPHEVPVETIKKFREKLRGRVQGQEDRDARISMLKKQAEKIKNENGLEDAIARVEQS